MKIFLIRHGETDWNADKKIQGPESSRLTKLGIFQANKIKKYFEENNLSFDKIYCSSTLRTKQTINEISKSNITFTSEIEERNHEDLVGMTKSDIEKRIGSKFINRLSWELYFEGTNKSILMGLSNDETIQNVRKRLNSFFKKLFLENNKTVLIVGHSIFNQYILEFLKFRTIGETQFGEFQKNNEIRILDLNEKFELINLDSVFV